jgi:eukaryotic-like serine/threonine-protein kinase
MRNTESRIRPSERASIVNDAFVGRDAELDELRAGLTRALEGRGQFFCLVGDPGIGKTRLAQEIALAAERAGAVVAWGRCWEGGGAPAYWPWIQIVRTLLSTFASEISQVAMPPSALAALHTLTGDAAEKSDSSPAVFSLPPRGGVSEPARFRLFDSVDTFLKRLSSIRPIAILLDDIHAADPDTLLLLRFLAREQLQSRVLILATMRDSEALALSEQSEVLSTIRREGRVVHLSGLTEDEVAALVERIRGAPPDQQLLTTLHDVCEGNPFYLDETLRLLNSEPRRTRRAAARIRIPDSVHEVIRRRIAPLKEETRALLEIAAVVGREFDSELLAEVAGLTQAECVSRLASAVRNGILRSTEPGRYRFGHAMIRETLTDDLPEVRRMELHRAVAEHLERLRQHDLVECLAELAEHHVRSLPLGSRDKAMEFARRGAERATQQFAHAEAARLYEMSLATRPAPDPEPALTCALTIEYGEALNRAGIPDRAREVILRAVEIARGGKNLDLLARAVLALGNNSATVTTVDQTLTSLIEETLSQLPGDDSPMRVMLLARLGAALRWSEQRERSLELCERAVEIARRLGDSNGIIYALLMWHYSTWSPDNLDERLRVAAEVVELTRRTGLLDGERRALERQLGDLCEKGRMHDAQIVLGAYSAKLEEAGYHDGSVELAGAMRTLLAGDFAEGERLAEQALALGQRVQEPRALLAYAAQITIIRFEQGRLGELEPILNAYVQQYPNLDVARCGLALACIQGGREAAARAEFEYLARENFTALKKDWNWLATMAVAAEVAVYLRDAERAARIYELMLPYADRNITIGWYEVSYGAVARYLGKLAALVGRFDEAERHFDQAIAMHQALGAIAWQAHAHHEYAAMLLARGAANDHERAAELIQSALASADTLGMKKLGDEARQLRRRLSAGESASSAPLPAQVRPGARTMVSVLFVDIVGSTEMAARIGDGAWRELLGKFYAEVRASLARFEGREVENPGDGFLAVFPTTLAAINSARQIATAVRALGLRIRAGVHVGECEWIGHQAVGITIHIGARIAAAAEPDQLLVSAAARDVVSGSGLEFDDAGTHQLRGVPGEWQLFRVAG